MKRLSFLLLLAVLVGSYTFHTDAQEERRTPQVRRGTANRNPNEQQAEQGVPELTVRAQNLNEQLTRDIANARWMRIVYRELNMLNEKNAPLYYPVTPVNGVMNLFTTIFQLAADGKLPLYEYRDGYEAFDNDHLLNFREHVLDRFEILYQTASGQNGEQRYIINESDIPSPEVKAFYVKEAWYFDQNNSIYDVKLLAICPIITRTLDVGDQTTPMCWIVYEDLRPYVAGNLIMTSNLNNARTFTIDDYFRRRMFDGAIIKTENLLNIPLQAYCPTPDSMKSEQQRIENELTAFRKALWFQPDTTTQTVADKKAARKAARAATRSKKEKSTSTTTKAAKTPKTPKAPKTKTSSASRSVRARR